ncbi:uncharacterized protein LOC112603918 [Melanaphis sacchari]|uniref:uncharacterized protein LOC112603918 n=1 Tax=Melanaphis sacchari TaxID=742174 RepID=UPI000DC13037|nr:uncharacterized protein LOC112603918 [Melanaphis sacchari]
MDQPKKTTHRFPSKKLSVKKSLSSRVMNILGIRAKTNSNPDVVEPVVESFSLGAGNQPPCSSRETISKMVDLRDNETNDWGTEKVLHNLTFDEFICSNQESKYDF